MSEAAETHEDACPGSALEGGFASGSTADRRARGEERAVEPRTAGKGGAGRRAGAHAWRHKCARCRVQGNTRPFAPSKLPCNGFHCGAFLTGKVSFSGKAREPFAE